MRIGVEIMTRITRGDCGFVGDVDEHQSLLNQTSIVDADGNVVEAGGPFPANFWTEGLRGQFTFEAPKFPSARPILPSGTVFLPPSRAAPLLNLTEITPFPVLLHAPCLLPP